MKAVFISFLFVLTISAIHAQSDLHAALSKGDAAGIAGYFGPKVELTISGKEYMVSKAEAERHLRDFFSAHPARGFSPKHKGTSKDNDSNYSIGELTTDKGNFRVYIYFQQEGQKRLVSELRIES